MIRGSIRSIGKGGPYFFVRSRGAHWYGGGVWEGRWEGVVREGLLGGQVGQFGGYMPPTPSVGETLAPLTCPPSYHTITLNLALTVAAS